MEIGLSDGTQLHVVTAGPPQGSVVVLVHGLAGSIELSWRSTGVIDRMADAGLHVVAFDLRGHGSTTTSGAPEQFEQSRLVDDVRTVVERYPKRAVVLVGYSLGAALALLAMQEGLAVKAAVIAGAAPSVLRWTDEDERRRTQTAAALRGSTAVDDDLLGFMALFKAIGADTDALAHLFDHHRPTVEAWDAIGDRVFVVAGSNDSVAAPVEELVERLPNATGHRVPGDHYTAPASAEITDLVLGAARS